MLDFNEDAKLTFALSVRSIKTPIDLGCCFHFHNSCPLMKAVVRFSAIIHKINWFCPKNQEIVVQQNILMNDTFQMKRWNHSLIHRTCYDCEIWLKCNIDILTVSNGLINFIYYKFLVLIQKQSNKMWQLQKRYIFCMLTLKTTQL